MKILSFQLYAHKSLGNVFIYSNETCQRYSEWIEREKSHEISVNRVDIFRPRGRFTWRPQPQSMMSQPHWGEPAVTLGRADRICSSSQGDDKQSQLLRLPSQWFDDGIITYRRQFVDCALFFRLLTRSPLIGGRRHAIPTEESLLSLEVRQTQSTEFLVRIICASFHAEHQ